MKAIYYAVTFLAAMFVLAYTGFQTYLHWPEIVQTFEKAANTEPVRRHRHHPKRITPPNPPGCGCSVECKCPECKCNQENKCNPNCICNKE